MIGFQLRYIFLIDKACKITVPIIPFSRIDEIGAGMYKGQKKQASEVHQVEQSATGGEGGGSNPTRTLNDQNTVKTQ